MCTQCLRALQGSHQDFDAKLYKRYFETSVTYAGWKALPRGVKTKPASGQNAYVISLTTWPPRTKKGTQGIWLTIESLMRQSVKPDRIILWLSLEEYPGGLVSLPQTLIDLQARGLETIFFHGNNGAANKLFPALKAQLKANIITVDDDILYPAGWLHALVKSHQRSPQAIQAIAKSRLKVRDRVLQSYAQSSGHDTSGGRGDFLDLALGFAGVLYPYDATHKTYNGLHKRALKRKYITLIAKADDLWFYACRVLARTPLCIVGVNAPIQQYITFLELNEPLWRANVLAGRNNQVFRTIFKKVPKLGQLLDLDLSKPQCVELNPVPSSGSYWGRLGHKMKKWVAKFALV